MYAAFWHHLPGPAPVRVAACLLLLALVVAAMNLGLWWWGNLPHGPEDWHGKIDGFALKTLLQLYIFSRREKF